MALTLARWAWRGAWEQARQRPRQALVIGALSLIVLGGLGYWASGHLSTLQHRRHGRQALEAGDYTLALAELGKCLQRWPNDVETHLLMARAHRLAGDHPAANRHLLAAENAGGSAERIALETELIEATAGRLDQVEEKLLEQ